MRILTIVVLGSVVTLCAMGGPDISGTPDELTAHLRSIPGRLTLTGEAEMKVEADRAEVVVKVSNSDRSLKNALAQNQQMRADVMTVLEKSGIPAERIRMSRFSSTPTQGYFTSKVKSYEIESRVTIEATSEKEIQCVASLVDEKEGVSLLSLTFSSTQKDKNAAEVLHQALAKVNALRGIYERDLGVLLIPRAVGPQPASGPVDLARRGVSVGKDVSGISSVLTHPELSVTLHALAQSEPDVSQFDQVVYAATVSVTFDVVKEERK